MKLFFPQALLWAGAEVLQRAVVAVRGILWMAVCFLLGPLAGQGSPLVMDDFAYASTTAARTAWVAVSAPSVNMASSGAWGPDRVMNLTCDFATRETRCYWDRAVSLNLAAFTDFALEVFAPDPGAISYFTLYFRSGTGWYGGSVEVSQTGWQTLRFSKARFIPCLLYTSRCV